MSPADFIVREAGPEDVELVRELFREYAEWVGSEICFRSFERELAELPGRYASPEGRLLIALAQGVAAGCAGLRRLDAEAAEMKRLYVRPAFRGSGLGRVLADRVAAEARGSGYRFLRLDSLPRMQRAIALYRALGFEEIPRYGDNPAEAICFELRLS